MSAICDSDLQFLKPGKRVLLKTYEGLLVAPADVKPEQNYWLLVGSKAVTLKRTDDNERVLLRFEKKFSDLGLHGDKSEENSLWILISDLKFVCRY